MLVEDERELPGAAGEIKERPAGRPEEEALLALYRNCRLCPRACGVDRTAGERGRCRMGAQAVAARAALHMWEEPCLAGTGGAGAVFFTGCSLGCVYCQNAQISGVAGAREAAGARQGAGREVSPERLTRIFLRLQDEGAQTLDLVTAAHFIPHIVIALRAARAQGLRIPVVYNSSGYESAQMLRLLEGLVDIYMPDFKYMDPETARRWSGAPDYPDRAKEAIAEMVRQVPECIFDENGMMQRGVLVRHLLLPGHVKEGCSIVSYLHETYGDAVTLSLMSQYTPMPQMQGDPLLGRKVTAREYGRFVDHAIAIGIDRGYVQEGEAAKESFIPEFNGEGVED